MKKKAAVFVILASSMMVVGCATVDKVLGSRVVQTGMHNMTRDSAPSDRPVKTECAKDYATGGFTCTTGDSVRPDSRTSCRDGMNGTLACETTR